jgi:vacuolar iron transporter family protein
MRKETERILLKAQKAEITEYAIYKKLAAGTESNRELLLRISDDELSHYDFLKKITGKRVKPDRFKIFFYIFLSRFLGLTFGLKLMERGEDLAGDIYSGLEGEVPQISRIIDDEDRHERELLGLLSEERLKYISSIVLGLNDALVELTGVLSGLTLALQSRRLVALVGLITGIAAALSMAASEYLATKQEETAKSPLKASIYTGIAYIITVLILIAPYLIFENIFLSLGAVIFNALLIILFFTFYISVAKELSFKKRFFEMVGLSISIAAVSFFIGFFVRKVFGIEI